ncbi:MAG: hypothetical protein KIT33_07680 [Candidatus Kapabacteria bacterium]|nr:hypothetical protein [Ignavibacteriota bacterium]MCW5884833.1 hypothetical protein [Candidatus Kapabacteria bacterium]
MPTSTDKKIILTGSPFAWIHKIENEDLSELWKFNNLQSSTYKILKPGSSSQGSENIDINRADGAIWRFPKTNLILSGEDESDITPADASSDASNKGEITLVINEAPIESNSWTAFIKQLKDNMDAKFLITIGTGYSHKARTDATLRKPDGFIHMIGKVNNDLEQQLNNSPASITITFVSYKNSGLEATDLTAVSLFTAITWKLGGTGKDIEGIKPPDLLSTDAERLLTGDVVVITNITYS